MRTWRDGVAPVALFDLDGTLADYDGAMRRDMSALAGPGEVVVTDKATLKAMPHLQARRDLIRSQPGWWERLERCNLGWDILLLAKAEGFTCRVLSKVPKACPSAATEKLRWRAAHVHDQDVTFTTTRDKSHVYGALLVDDWPDYFMPWLEQRPRGWVIAPKRPWNEGTVHPRLLVYDGWTDSTTAAETLLGKIATRFEANDSAAFDGRP